MTFCDIPIQPNLVGGFNSPEKYARQIGSFPPINRGENKQPFKPPPVVILRTHTVASITASDPKVVAFVPAPPVLPAPVAPPPFGPPHGQRPA